MNHQSLNRRMAAHFSKNNYSREEQRLHKLAQAYAHGPKVVTPPGWLESQLLVCNGCGEDISLGLTIDHIYPRSRGGTEDAENFQLLCKSCNSSKNDRTMREWVETRNPRCWLRWKDRMAEIPAGVRKTKVSKASEWQGAIVEIIDGRYAGKRDIVAEDLFNGSISISLPPGIRVIVAEDFLKKITPKKRKAFLVRLFNYKSQNSSLQSPKNKSVVSAQDVCVL